MKYSVLYKIPKKSKEQKAVFLNLEDSFLWEKHVKENLKAWDVKIIPS